MIQIWVETPVWDEPAIFLAMLTAYKVQKRLKYAKFSKKWRGILVILDLIRGLQGQKNIWIIPYSFRGLDPHLYNNLSSLGRLFQVLLDLEQPIQILHILAIFGLYQRPQGQENENLLGVALQCGVVI